MNIEVRFLPGDTDYAITSSGELFSRCFGEWRKLKESVNGRGHCYKVIRRRFTFIHTLVLEAFVGPRPQGYECCHGNGNPSDNRLANLRWDTQSSNAIDRSRHGVGTVLDVEAVRAIRRRHAEGASCYKLGKEFGVDESNIRHIIHGRTWGHVSDASEIAEMKREVVRLLVRSGDPWCQNIERLETRDDED